MKLPHDIGITLVCPHCRVAVAHVADAYVCRSPECRRSYPIVDGIPKFLIDDARILTSDDWHAVIPQNGHQV